MHEDVHEDFVNKLKASMEQLTVGDPFDKQTDYGAIINQQQLDSIDEKVQNAIKMALL